MRTWFRARATLVSLVLALALVVSTLAACSTSRVTATSTSGNKHLVLATDLPVSGPDAAGGLPTQYGVDLAVLQHHELGHGYTLDVKHYNDAGTSGVDSSLGAANVTQAASDPAILALVGPLNSGVARVEVPIITRDHLVEISPSNTTPGLTLQQYAQQDGITWSQLHPAGVPEYYFRIPGNDVVQGRVDAEIASDPPVSAKTVFVVDDSTTYGKGLAHYFTDAFTRTGGTVIGTATITANQISSLPSLATTIAGGHPDCIFYGGITSGGGGALKQDVVAAGYTGPLVGGDGIAGDPTWQTSAGPAAGNTYGTVAAPDLSQFSAGPAAAFLRAFADAFPGQPPYAYSSMAYDAAMVAITAIQHLIASGQAVTREHLRDAVARVRYTGVTGTISFDAHGDNAGTRVFSVYATDATTSHQWRFIRQVIVA